MLILFFLLAPKQQGNEKCWPSKWDTTRKSSEDSIVLCCSHNILDSETDVDYYTNQSDNPSKGNSTYDHIASALQGSRSCHSISSVRKSSGRWNVMYYPDVMLHAALTTSLDPPSSTPTYSDNRIILRSVDI